LGRSTTGAMGPFEDDNDDEPKRQTKGSATGEGGAT
jgi:hypothetical protein